MDLTLAFGLGRPEDLLVVVAVVILLFNGHKLAEFGRRLGGGPGNPPSGITTAAADATLRRFRRLRKALRGQGSYRRG